MRANGTIQLGMMSEATENEYGELVSDGEVVYSEPIPCSVKTNSDTQRGRYVDGVFRQASFIVLIELENVVDITNVKIERRGEQLGEYQVISSEPLDSVGRTQIMV